MFDGSVIFARFVILANSSSAALFDADPLPDPADADLLAAADPLAGASAADPLFDPAAAALAYPAPISDPALFSLSNFALSAFSSSAAFNAATIAVGIATAPAPVANFLARLLGSLIFSAAPPMPVLPALSAPAPRLGTGLISFIG